MKEKLDTMTKEEFKEKWESDEITWDDIAECAIGWGIDKTPRIHNVFVVRDKVLAYAGCSM